jgi:hypothetical protein
LHGPIIRAALAHGKHIVSELPHTPPAKVALRVTARDVLGLDALRLLRDSSFAVFVLGSFLIYDCLSSPARFTSISAPRPTCVPPRKG